MRTVALWAALALAGCGLDPKKIPKHEVYAADGVAVEEGRTVSFAVVGSTRSVLWGTKGEPEIPQQVIADLVDEAPVRGVDFVVLSGGAVRRSTTDEWKRFGTRWSEALRSEIPSTNKGRVEVMPLPGDGEILGDRKLRGFGAAFPDVGARIGYNRTASWQAFDIELDGAKWRLLFLDTHKGAMGSRWDEQLFWLPKVVTADYDAMLVFLPDPFLTLAKGSKMDLNDAPSALLDVIDDHSDVLKLKAVFAGGAPTNELYLPTGAYGEAYVVAGNAGIDSPDLRRWGRGEEAGMERVALDPGFDMALLSELDRWAAGNGLPPKVVETARATGESAGDVGVYDGKEFPVQGYWFVELDGTTIAVTFRMRRYDGSFHDLYAIRHTERDGWQQINQ